MLEPHHDQGIADAITVFSDFRRSSGENIEFILRSRHGRARINLRNSSRQRSARDVLIVFFSFTFLDLSECTTGRVPGVRKPSRCTRGGSDYGTRSVACRMIFRKRCRRYTHPGMKMICFVDEKEGVLCPRAYRMVSGCCHTRHVSENIR